MIDFNKLTLAEINLSTELLARIKQVINQHQGIIPFSQFMELALYTPTLGYYTNPLYKFGVAGDFITAPLVSNLFGFCCAKQINQIFELGSAKNILEFGAGNGKLAADILNSLNGNFNKYYILELSANLKNYQYETISQKAPQFLNQVVWLEKLPTNFNGVILANEVLDAMPVTSFQINNQSIVGLGVGLGLNQELIYKNHPLSEIELSAIKVLALKDLNNYSSEIHLVASAFIQTLANSLEKGGILLIDYGFNQTEYYHYERNKGSLRGFFRHQLVENVLLYPGLIDITSSINWSLIADSAINSGLELVGYTTQAHFLINLGLNQILAELQQNLAFNDYITMVKQVEKLVLPKQMGEIFKVCALAKGINHKWLGFSQYDQSHKL